MNTSFSEEATSLDDDLHNLALEEHTPTQQFCLSLRLTVSTTTSTAALTKSQINNIPNINFARLRRWGRLPWLLTWWFAVEHCWLSWCARCTCSLHGEVCFHVVCSCTQTTNILLKTCRALDALLLAFLCQINLSRSITYTEFVLYLWKISELWANQQHCSLSMLWTRLLAPCPMSRTFKAATLPRGNDLDWFSPMTSTLCNFSTMSGKVVCWDVHPNTCLAEWDPGEN